MAKRKKAQPWDAVFDRIRGVHYAHRVYEPKPTVEELDGVEAELGFKFPFSYRDFAERFGLNGRLHVLPELFPLRLSQTAQSGESVVDNTLSIQGKRPELRHAIGFRAYDDIDLPGTLSQVVVFACDSHYSTFVFNPGEVIDPHSRECRIYSLGSGYDATAIANSFAEWVLWVHEHYYFPENEDEDEWVEQYPRFFKPNPSSPDAIPYNRDGVRQKNAPSESDVALWLAFNNHTVRDLALAIRDRGLTDAFPILADALQEAGCDTADLLSSCRTGDPDIDGVWVLRVLLGEG